MKKAVEKHLWYHVVLDMMEAKLPLIRSSAGEQNSVMALGEIFKKARMIPAEQYVIRERIGSFTVNRHVKNEGDTKIVYSFLSDLYDWLSDK